MSEDKIAATSRYFNVEQTTYETKNNRTIAHLKRRFISHGHGMEIGRHMVVEGDRPDTVSAKVMGDPAQYWRLCDYNARMHPRDLTGTIGSKIRISFPGGESV
jgi:hypothetical protein